MGLTKFLLDDSNGVPDGADFISLMSSALCRKRLQFNNDINQSRRVYFQINLKYRVSVAVAKRI
jgi:hypothetical protein